jgi:hypothetical protein
MKKYNHCTMIKVQLLIKALLLYLHCALQLNILKCGFCFSQSRQEDNNRDGKYDELYFEIQVQLMQNQVAHAVTLFLLFDYRLYVRA